MCTNRECVWRHLVVILEPTLLMIFYVTQQLYSKNIVQGASLTKNKHCDIAHLCFNSS